MSAARRATFVATILLGSFLLFLVQPMIARIALPRLGGAPAVWNSAMLVYQALLLAGYGYAHAIGRLPPLRQGAVHLGLLAFAALWLPIGLLGWHPPASVAAEFWAPWLIAASIGPLFVAVAAQAPLIQRWFALTSDGADPYRLYAASNLGSFAGLLAYPLAVEPAMAIDAQRWLWSAGYVALVALVVACVFGLPRRAGEVAPTPVPAAAAPRRRVAHWIALAAVPSGLMLATSTYISTDIVALPLLWVLPLGLYLLSFTIAFAANRLPAETLTRVAPITILLFGGVMIGGFRENPLGGVLLALLLLFMAATALHTALYRLRPEPAGLTGFYLAMAAGGALGGLFAGLVAPALFDWTWEYPLLILAAGALAPQLYLTAGIRDLWYRNSLAMIATIAFALALLAWLSFEDHAGIVFVAIAALGLVAIGRRPVYVVILFSALALFGGLASFETTLAGDARTRSYFGVYTIAETPTKRTLAHGTTLHGIQLLGSAERETTPTSYYVPTSGVGRALVAARTEYGTGARIGVVGLGTGTLACYARPRQDWRFFEIDPAVVTLARNRFDFLDKCAPRAQVVVGDARLSLASAPSGSIDLLALDAFSSDAIPVHLLTREAFAVYARALSPRGLLLVHISNRFLDLAPVVAAVARAGGWHSAALLDRPSSLDEGASLSHWVAMTRDAAVLRRLTAAGGDWTKLPAREQPWRDEYASILPLLNR